MTSTTHHTDTRTGTTGSTGTGIDRVGVVGSGIMGTGIAELCAKAGLDVRVVVFSETSLDTAPRRLTASLDRGVTRGKLTPPTAKRPWPASRSPATRANSPTATW